MKIKLNLQSFDVESAATWMGAFCIACALIGGIFAIGSFYADRYDAKLVLDPTAEERSKLFEAVPRVVEPELLAFDELNAAKPVEAKPVERAKVNPYLSWGYEGEVGPKFWSMLSKDFQLCDRGTEQSPINLAAAHSNPQAAPIRFSYRPSAAEVSNDGRMISIKPERGNMAISFNQNYQLDEVSIHTPSEHHLAAKRYDLEIQLHHKSPTAGRMSIAILASETPSGHSELQKLISDLPAKRDQAREVTNIDFERLMPGSEDYFYYNGSLTTPPCNEEVRWIVMRRPISVSAQQIDRLLSTTRFNARSLQSVKDHKIYQSW
jgi:carbonic anhydrase